MVERIVVETGRILSAGEVHVITPVLEIEDFLDSLVRGTDFGFAGGATCAGLTYVFPGNGAAAAHDEKAGHGAVLEHLSFDAIFIGRTDMAAPVGVTEFLEGLVI